VLVLSRKPGESILIAGNIRVTILSAIQGRVSVGIDADKSIEILREDAKTKEPKCPPNNS
jgi:carbon storage regulator